ncbi:GNAT family N-acetyltransferase [uncultured Solobacterium sp.]|uniref:GNAT family N-acetyltransferase n=1 Tax=uncultured Solobacterium sp. TaxID=747375 RepID=UPI0028EB2173|nr:GNAT family N-acetyltransferase [uncultured Solobacterium sp.]
MVTIHEAKQSDIKRLLELSLMWEKKDSCYGYRANTEGDFQDCYILAAYDDELIAYVFGKEEIQDKQTSVIDKNMHYFEVQEIYVHPLYRLRGIGKQLIERLEEELREKGIEMMLLSTATKNWRAILHFYIDEVGMNFWSARLYKRL